LALKPGVWFRRGRLLIVSPDSLGTACPLSGRNSTYRLVQILAGSNGFAIEWADSVDRACVIAPQSMGSSFWSGLACHSWSIVAGSSSARGPRCRISFFVWVSAAPEPPLFGTERAVETSCADSGATVNAFSGAAPCCRVFDRGGRGRTRDFAPSCPSAATCSRRPVFPEPEKSLRKSGLRRPRGRWIGS
jgi:hypothetical protein